MPDRPPDRAKRLNEAADRLSRLAHDAFVAGDRDDFIVLMEMARRRLGLAGLIRERAALAAALARAERTMTA
jgi:hypothetical protein